MRRKFSALGLEQPGMASAAPTLEAEKSPDVAALQTEPTTMGEVVSPVPTKSLAPATTEVEEGDAGAGKRQEKEPRVVEPAPEPPISEPIKLPP